MKTLLFVLAIVLLAPAALAQSLADDEENCGAVGYACQFGRECIDYRCEPAWLSIEDSGQPFERGGHAAAMIDGKFVVMGGCASLTPNDPAEASTGVYDPVENGWWNGPDMPSPRVHFSAISSPDGIYAFGGVTQCWNGVAVGPGLSLLETVESSWYNVVWANEPTPRYNAAMVWTGDSVMVYGGSNATSPSCSSGSEHFPGLGWSGAGCGLGGSARGGGYEMFVDSGTVKVWGGGCFGSMTNGLSFDIATGTWSPWAIPNGTPDVSTLTAGMGPPRSAWSEDFAYYLEPDGGVTIYDRLAGTWVSDDVEPPPGFCSEAAVAWTGTELIAWGGYCEGNFSSVGGRYQPPAL